MLKYQGSLSSFDLFLELEAFSEGRSTHAWRCFGAHPAEDEAGREGYLFRVWAPNAPKVTIIGDFNGWALDTQMATEDGKAYSCEIPALDGQFKIVDADWDEIVLGSNGDKVVFGEPYEAAEDGHSNMMLAAGKSTDIRVSLDLPTHTLVLEGTAGIASVGADTDSPEAYYTLQGIRLSERPTAPGVYIRRSGNLSEKICVK